MRQCRFMYEYFLPNNHLLKANNGNTNYMLFIKPGIQERGTECEEFAERGGMFTRIPGNLLEDSGECYYFNIPRNVPKEMFKKIPGNVQQDSGECLKRFWRMFKKIPGNAQEDFGNLNFDLFCEILLIFYQIL